MHVDLYGAFFKCEVFKALHVHKYIKRGKENTKH